MITYLEGTLFEIESERITLLVAGVGYEILLPVSALEKLKERALGDQVALHIYYHQTERQPKPALIGFHESSEKSFFQSFISVGDIGPLKAVKAMEISTAEIATAIEAGDEATLRKLKGIGPRTARKVIASLKGKMAAYALDVSRATEPETENILTPKVLKVLTEQLGHKPVEARQLIARALERNPAITTPEALFDEVYRGEINQ